MKTDEQLIWEAYSKGDYPAVDKWGGSIVYHGTNESSKKSIENKLIIPVTGGYFGTAFYVTDDPLLAKSNYADFAGEDNEDDPGVVLKFRISDDARILDLRMPEHWEIWGAYKPENYLYREDFHEIAVNRWGIDGVYDRSMGGLAIYNPEVLEYLGEYGAD